MISIFQFENLTKIVFKKMKKPEKSNTEEGLDELEFEQLICRKKKQEKKSQSDRKQLWKLLLTIKLDEWDMKTEI